ncbi:MAG: hypothetical protein QXD54_05465 [Candidatus Aenigmatarchaeota archaeon]
MRTFKELIEDIKKIEKRLIEKLAKAPKYKAFWYLQISVDKKYKKGVIIMKPKFRHFVKEEKTQEAKDLEELEQAIKSSPEATWLLIPIRFKFVLTLIEDMAYREGLNPEFFLYMLILEGLLKRYAKKREFYRQNYPTLVDLIERDLKWEVKFFEEIKHLTNLENYDSSAFRSKTGKEAYQKVTEEFEAIRNAIKTLNYQLSPLEQEKLRAKMEEYI